MNWAKLASIVTRTLMLLGLAQEAFLSNNFASITPQLSMQKFMFLKADMHWKD